MTTEEMSFRKSSESSPPPPPPPLSFSSLPYDLALNCLARVSRFHHPTLSLVSKGFRSLIASPELEATRSSIGKAEDCIYVCLDLNQNNIPNPQWFILSQVTRQEKLVPIPSFPYAEHPKSSTVISIGSEIYIIGGFLKRKRSRRVFILDCRSHQWRRLPNMRLPRVSAAVDVTDDGKIYVIGGSRSNNIEEWGEVYDPKTHTWEPLLPTTQDLTFQKSVVPGSIVMGGKVYDMDDSSKLYLVRDICLVEIDKVLCLIEVSIVGDLTWRVPNDADFGWSMVKGLKLAELSTNQLCCVVNSGGGRRLQVWWKSVVPRRQGRKRRWTNEIKTKIWCAEVSFERRGLEEELWGFLEWSKNVFTLVGGCDSPPLDLYLHSAIVTH